MRIHGADHAHTRTPLDIAALASVRSSGRWSDPIRSAPLACCCRSLPLSVLSDRFDSLIV